MVVRMKMRMEINEDRGKDGGEEFYFVTGDR